MNETEESGAVQGTFVDVLGTLVKIPALPDLNDAKWKVLGGDVTQYLTMLNMVLVYDQLWSREDKAYMNYLVVLVKLLALYQQRLEDMVPDMVG